MPPTVSIQVFSIGRGKYHRHSDVCDTTPMFVLGADMNYLPLPLPPSHPAPQDYPYTPHASLPSSRYPPPLRHPHLPLSRLLPVGSSTDMWASCSSYLSLHKSFFFLLELSRNPRIPVHHYIMHLAVENKYCSTHPLQASHPYLPDK